MYPLPSSQWLAVPSQVGSGSSLYSQARRPGLSHFHQGWDLHVDPLPDFRETDLFFLPENQMSGVQAIQPRGVFREYVTEGSRIIW